MDPFPRLRVEIDKTCPSLEPPITTRVTFHCLRSIKTSPLKLIKRGDRGTPTSSLALTDSPTACRKEVRRPPLGRVKSRDCLQYRQILNSQEQPKIQTNP
jgi:hypothetical protein